MKPPVIDAGAAMTLQEGDTAQLQGQGPDDADHILSWVVLSGPDGATFDYSNGRYLSSITVP